MLGNPLNNRKYIRKSKKKAPLSYDRSAPDFDKYENLKKLVLIFK